MRSSDFMKKVSSLTDAIVPGLKDFHKSRKMSPISDRFATEMEGPFKDRYYFFNFIYRDKANKRYFQIAGISAIVQFIVFKILYPFPDFISDSYSYIDTNIYNMSVNLWPIGYSKFLLWLHQISYNDTFLITVQFLLIEIALIYFFYTVLFFYRPAKNTTIVLYIFLFFNPLFLYISNAVLSDTLFAALTILLLTQFLWILYRPTTLSIIVQGIIIGLAFTVRYTAIYYPIVALAGLLLSRYKPSLKIIGFLLGISFIVPYYLYTAKKTKEITGTSEFSVFGGWQIANNALYMYDHINVDSNKIPSDTRELDRLSKLFFERIHPSTQELSALPGTYFIKVPYAILKPYMAFRFSYEDAPGQFRAWGMVSPIYNKYGKYLIMHYPFKFMQYYLWLNTKNYFLPHLEKFHIYNLDINTVPVHVQDWFKYVTPDVTVASKTAQQKICYIYPILFMLLNIYFMCRFIWLYVTGEFRRMSDYFRMSLLFIGLYLVVNFAFSVFATPVVLRYQLIPLVILFTYTLLLLEYPDNDRQLKSIQ